MQGLVISEKSKKEIVKHCLMEKPNEACGLLAGIKDRDKRLIKDVYSMKNTEKSPERYFMDPEQQFSALKDIRSNEGELLAIYHSHPHSEAVPSERDIEMAHMPDVLYVIISLASREPDIRAYTIKKGEDYREVEVVVRKGALGELRP